MLQTFTVYYADSQTRIQAMIMCSFNEKINWMQNGLGVVTFKFNKVCSLQANSLSQVYNKLKVLNVDKRKKKKNRTISVGDVICVQSQSWIVTSNGFQKIPWVLWEKVRKN